MDTYKLKFENAKAWVHHLETFIKTVEEIAAWNKDPAHTFKKGLNQFSHLTGAEWKEYLGLKPIPTRMLRKKQNSKVHGEPTVALGAFSNSVNWVTAGAVTGVKNQGQCGGCWSFSTTGAIEGARQINYGPLVSLSEQLLISCDTSNNGCGGGWVDDAFDWAGNNGGLCTESSYPYTSFPGPDTQAASGVCMATPPSNEPNTAPTNYYDVQAGSVAAMQSAVNVGPVSIAIEADQSVFQSYAGGVITSGCGTNLDHAVLIVGYGTDPTYGDYWLVKNSWGTSWGLSGYVQIAADATNQCGLLSAGSYPVV